MKILFTVLAVAVAWLTTKDLSRPTVSMTTGHEVVRISQEGKTVCKGRSQCGKLVLPRSYQIRYVAF